MTPKPYKARSLAGAQRFVRELLKQRREVVVLLERFDHERKVLAKLAADGPAFFNPIQIIEAKGVRDEILRCHCRMNPDGSPLVK